MNITQSRYNLLLTALVLQVIPIIAIGMYIGFWLAGVQSPKVLTTGILVGTSIVALVHYWQTIRLLDNMKLSSDENSVNRLEQILANTKLALLLNAVGAFFLII